MTCNVGKIDRIARSIISMVLIIWGLSSSYLFMIILGVSILFTAISGWCVLYAFLGLNTGCQNKDTQ